MNKVKQWSAGMLLAASSAAGFAADNAAGQNIISALDDFKQQCAQGAFPDVTAAYLAYKKIQPAPQSPEEECALEKFATLEAELCFDHDNSYNETLKAIMRKAINHDCGIYEESSSGQEYQDPSPLAW